MRVSFKLPGDVDVVVRRLTVKDVETCSDAARSDLSDLSEAELLKSATVEEKLLMQSFLLEYDGKAANGALAEAAYRDMPQKHYSLLQRAFQKLNGPTAAEEKAFDESMKVM
jgi:hypothetical protein